MSTTSAPPTLAAIAAEAGVSLATISKVLNGREDVAAQTRQRVETLLAERGYRRRGTRSSHARLIELVMPTLSNTWAIEVIEGVRAAAEERGLALVLTRSGDRHVPGPDWIDAVVARNPIGVVLVFNEVPPSMRKTLRARSIPFVVMDPAGEPADDVPAVGAANWAGGLAAVRHLISLGHERVAVISGPEDMMCSHARIGGYRTAMVSAGLAINDRWVLFGNFDPESGHDRACSLLDDEAPPTAIFAGSDLQGMGVYEAARERGLCIPADLSIVGFDNIPLTRWLTPRMTTVSQPLALMGREAVRIVTGLAAGTIVGTPRLDLATSLVERESTAPPARHVA